MTYQPYLYDPQANVLRQRAEMEEPSWHYGFPEGGPSDSLLESAYADYNYRCEEYSAHLASLPAYTPVSGWVPEVGKEYYEGKDFEVKEYTAKFGFETYGSRVAVPIEQNEPLTEKDFDDLTELARKERGPVFSLQDMIECWEAAIRATEGNCRVETIDWDRTCIFVDEAAIVGDKKQYFKHNFNIDLP